MIELKRSMIILETEICTRRRVLKDAFSLISQKAKPPLDMLYLSVYELLDDSINSDTAGFATIWDRALFTFEKCTSLNSSDMEMLTDIGKVLEEGSIKGQAEGFIWIFDMINAQIENVKNEIKDKSKVTVVMGFLVGIMIVITFI